ncbi:hypothetical protein V1279_000690 [Bradyrhizobium sp. AZCC 1610]|uniref:hypothetical protein n=1 Tax=Bradyrhizobium sp. AZCC 1610 TaxID=3117020 RepID=UPI002FF21529
MAGTLYAEAASGTNIDAGVIGEAQSCRSIAAEIENKGIVRALEAYSGPAVLLGDDNIILRLATEPPLQTSSAARIFDDMGYFPGPDVVTPPP